MKFNQILMDEQQFREIDGRHKDLIKLEGLIKETNGLFVDISNITDAQVLKILVCRMVFPFILILRN